MLGTPKYKVTIELDKDYKGSGATIIQAIDDTGLSFFDVKTNGFIVIQKGKYEIRKYFLARQMKRLFNQSTVKKFFPINMESMFKIMEEKKMFKKEIML